MKLHQESCSKNENENIENSNITIIQVSNPRPHNSNINQFSLNLQPNLESTQNLNTAENSYKSNDINLSLHKNLSEIKVDPLEETVQNRSEINILNTSHIRNNTEINVNKLKLSQNENTITTSDMNHEYYEKIFLPSTSNSITNVPVNIVARIPPKSPKFSLLSKQQRSVSHSELHINRDRIHSTVQSSLMENAIKHCNSNVNVTNTTYLDKSIPSTSTKRDEISTGSPVKHILMRGMTELQIKSRQQINLNHNLTNANSSNFKISAIRNGEKRRRSLSSSEASRSETQDRNTTGNNFKKLINIDKDTIITNFR